HRFVMCEAPPTHVSPLSLHDALPISGIPRRRALCQSRRRFANRNARRNACLGLLLSRNDICGVVGNGSRPLGWGAPRPRRNADRSEEHTSELQSRENLVCRLLLEKKK